jgi:hypothetical protein
MDEWVGPLITAVSTLFFGLFSLYITRDKRKLDSKETTQKLERIEKTEDLFFMSMFFRFSRLINDWVSLVSCIMERDDINGSLRLKYKELREKTEQAAKDMEQYYLRSTNYQ